MKSLILSLMMIMGLSNYSVANDKFCSEMKAEFLNESIGSQSVELGRLIVAGGTVCQLQNGANKLDVALHSIIESIPLLGNSLLEYRYGTKEWGGAHAVTLYKDGSRDYFDRMVVDFRTYYLNDPKTYKEISSADKEKYIVYQSHPSAIANGLAGDLLGGIGFNAFIAGVDYGVIGPGAWLFTGEYKTLLKDENRAGGMLDVLYSYSRARRAKFTYERDNGINSCGKYRKAIKCMYDIISKSRKLASNSNNDNLRASHKINGNIEKKENHNFSKVTSW